MDGTSLTTLGGACIYRDREVAFPTEEGETLKAEDASAMVTAKFPGQNRTINNWHFVVKLGMLTDLSFL